jgi:hypothetical protein
MNKQQATWLLALTSLLLSCTEQDLPGEDVSQDASRRICFRSATLDDAFFTRGGLNVDYTVAQDTLPLSVQILPWDASDDDATTRGALLTTSTIANFKVSARMTRTSDSSTYYIFQDETNTRPSSDDSYWQYASNKIYYWPGSDWTVDIYAVAPATASVSYPDSDTRDSFTYTTPSSPANQVDLMVASQTGVAGNINAALSLNFSHISTAVEFAVGNSDIFDGSIDEITLSGVANEATYSYATSSWSTPTGSASYTITPASGNSFGDSQRLVLLPQELADDAQLQITYSLNGESQQRTYTYSLKGQTWSAANCYRYTLNMAPEMTISFSETKLDAHYVMTTADITVAGIKGNWSIVGSGSSGTEAVSLQLESEVNSYAKQGYWTANSRGCDSISGKGSGTYAVRIFAPENVTEKERTYTLAFHSGGKTFTTNTELKQSCPDWVGNYGWERGYDEGSGTYGFKRSKVSVYVINFNQTDVTSTDFVYAFRCLTYLEETIMPQFDSASEYVVEGISNYFGYWSGISYNAFYYFYIKYAEMPSNITGTDSPTNGIANTTALSTKDLTTDICGLEQAVIDTTPSDANVSGDIVYRVPSSSNSKESTAKKKEASDNSAYNTSGITDCVLKKNAYNINNGSLELVELKWYIPAVEQNDCPTGMNAGDYWSSTSAEKNTSYLLNGDKVDREESHSVRAVRNLN